MMTGHAFEMFSTNSKFQVLKDTYEILKDRGFEFEQRGYVNVKGKGKLLTYILMSRTFQDCCRPVRFQNNNIWLNSGQVFWAGIYKQIQIGREK